MTLKSLFTMTLKSLSCIYFQVAEQYLVIDWIIDFISVFSSFLLCNSLVDQNKQYKLVPHGLNDLFQFLDGYSEFISSPEPKAYK